MGEKLAELNDKYVRTVAEFENYRKRTNQEKADLILNGGKDVIKNILPIIDDLERALQAMTDENAKEGVTMIYNKLLSTLQQKGLKPMEAQAKLEAKINQLKNELMNAKIVDTSRLKGDIVQILSKVEMTNVKTNARMTYTIVSESEANLREGKISITTPIAQGLLGKKAGDTAVIKIPQGTIELKIESISL